LNELVSGKKKALTLGAATRIQILKYKKFFGVASPLFDLRGRNVQVVCAGPLV